jgi:hypothetical protein
VAIYIIMELLKFRSIILASFFLIIIGINSLLASPKKIDISLTIQPVANWQISQLESAVKEGDPLLNDIVSMTLRNEFKEDKEIKLRIRVFANKVSSSVPLIDYTTSYDNYPIDINADGVFIINSRDQGMVTGGILRGNRDSIESKLRSAYGDSLLGYSGWIPEDTYRYEIYAFEKDSDESNLKEAIGYESEVIVMPAHDSHITIIQPSSTIITGENPVFSWEPVLARDGVAISYKLSLYEISSFSTEQPIGTPIFEESTQSNSVTFPSSVQGLSVGQKYSFRVVATDELGHRVAQSNYTEFQWGSIQVPTLILDDQSVSDFPFNLSWTTLDPSVKYQVRIADKINGNEGLKKWLYESPILTGLNQFSITSSFKDIILPGKTYYWIVKVLDDQDQVVASSEVGQFLLNSEILVIAPIDNIVISEPYITFGWTGSSDRSYRVKISDNKGFSKSINYQVNGLSLSLPVSDLGLNRKMSYFWQVIEVDSAGNEWGDPSDTGLFQLAPLEVPEIISPKNEIISEEVYFSFSLVSWAVSYRVDIFDKSNNTVYSSPQLNEGFLKLNLLDISEISPGDHYTWTVTAMSEDAIESEVSSEGRFRMKKNDISYDIDLIDKPEFLTPTAVISWTPINEPGVTYTLQLSNNVRFVNPLEFELKDARYEFKSVDEYSDDLYYRIFAYDSSGRELVQSKTFKISISDIDVLHETIVLVSPDEEVSINSRKTFNWLPKLKNATLLISTKKNMRQAEVFEVSGDSIDFDEIKYNFEVGVTYYWTIQKENHKSKMVNSFKLVPSIINLVQPLQKEVTDKLVLFQWMSEDQSLYRLVLAQDKNFKKVLTEIDTKKSMLEYELEDYGKVYWKVQQLDESKKIVQESEVSFLHFKEPRNELTSAVRRNLEYFLKQNLEDDSKIKIDEWKLIKTESIGKSVVSEEDINYLLDNKNSLIRIVE